MKPQMSNLLATNWTMVCEFKNCTWISTDVSEASCDAQRRRHYDVDHDVTIVRGSESVTVVDRAPKPPKTEREKVLEEVAGLIAGERDVTYGPPLVNFTRAAEAINAIFGPRLNQPFTAGDIATIQILLKLSRQAHAPKRDNWVDVCGYAACGAEVEA